MFKILLKFILLQSSLIPVVVDCLDIIVVVLPFVVMTGGLVVVFVGSELKTPWGEQADLPSNAALRSQQPAQPAPEICK